MRISLVRISLLRFFKTFQKYLAYAFLWLLISLLRFYMYLANVIIYLMRFYFITAIWLMRFWGYYSQKITLMK